MKRLLTIFLLINLFILTSCGTGSSNESLKIANDVEYGNEDYRTIVSSNNQLGFELMEEAERDDNGNIFISPTSLVMALSMVYNGADGVTKEEMANVLHIEGIDAEELNKANASLMSILFQNTKDVQLNVANSIWLNEHYHFQEAFAEKNKDYFNAEIREINISDPEAPNTMNDWVKNATNGKINQIVEPPINPDLVTILINAIYFKGNWTHPFNKEQTEKSIFTLESGNTKEVSLMRLNEKLAYMENEMFQAVSLPYGDDQNLSMKVFLPRENVPISQFEKLLNNTNWVEWKSEFKEKEGTILLPRFQLEYEALLNDTLKTLGMPSAFDNANFSKMIEENAPLYISKVTQKTFLDVNEEGTEAAAATSVEIVTESASAEMPFYMEVNRPFFIAITDDKTGVVLFMGSISNPIEKTITH